MKEAAASVLDSEMGDYTPHNIFLYHVASFTTILYSLCQLLNPNPVYIIYRNLGNVQYKIYIFLFSASRIPYSSKIKNGDT